MPKPFVIDKLCCQRQQTILFSNLSFQLDTGEVLAIEGANGSGKSSLLRLLAGLVTPTSGDIFWHSKSIAEDGADYKQHFHYIGHQNGLRLDLTVAENLSHLDESLLTALELTPYLRSPTRLLSAGQKRKVALARLISSQKKLWLLDEPLNALDINTQAFFLSALQQHLQQDGIAVISTHQSIPLASIKVIRL